ncbi:hypothetical protein [Rhizobium bangladeshense]|uniref:hypothetical protein n=1 Tax=Rhizobium bangladeshense TaxID=1138189 RepID=UPI000ABE681C|nr:hypothetical protein [Rhizobium bangladeshense]
MRIYKTASPGEAVAGGIAGTIAIGIGEIFRLKDATTTPLEKFGENAIERLRDYVFVVDDLERVERQAFGEVMSAGRMHGASLSKSRALEPPRLLGTA